MQVLVLTPDKELAYQIAQTLKPVGLSLPSIQLDQALGIYKRQKPRIALVDLETPYPGGLVAASKLRNLSLMVKQELYIILMGKRAEPALIERARQQGVDDYLLIPLRPEILAQKMDPFIES